jgi:hypothetical protein
VIVPVQVEVAVKVQDQVEVKVHDEGVRVAGGSANIELALPDRPGVAYNASVLPRGPRPATV